ncbi:hypothetical protein [Planctomyces sp. SH-PL62]|uniref:hypothetical protein n=1 Tax=Planctomyces sp. SH-PL62 TaxID=1636152 RepID=UPI00078CD8F6|nr:hypothetical protein [Planctomyces sp. SH-PL62]AMV38204.1 hypothetical protein VT85_12255 [Planctomyces sp. SH-PL62]
MIYYQVIFLLFESLAFLRIQEGSDASILITQLPLVVLVQAPSEAAPGLPEVDPRGDAVESTRRAINEEIDRRLDPNSVYMRAQAGRLANFPRQVVNRAVFESLYSAQGDEGIVLDALRLVKKNRRSFPIDLGVEAVDVSWVRKARQDWVALALRSLDAQEAVGKGEEVVLLEIPPQLWITSMDGKHVASDPVTSNLRQRLERERDYLAAGTSGFELSARHVASLIAASFSNPAEPFLMSKLLRGEEIGREYFYARMYQAVFLNVGKFYADANLLADALDIVNETVPGTADVKNPLLNEFQNIRVQRINWLRTSVIPALETMERAPREVYANQAAPQQPSGFGVDLPSIAWVLRDPYRTGMPKEFFYSSSDAAAEEELLRRAR